MQSMISPIGPKKSPLYYAGISIITIDYVKRMTTKKEIKRGWVKLPKNKTDIKVEIIV